MLETKQSAEHTVPLTNKLECACWCTTTQLTLGSLVEKINAEKSEVRYKIVHRALDCCWRSKLVSIQALRKLMRAA